MTTSTPRTRTPLALGAIAAVLYLSEGLPYGVVNDLVPVYLRFHHVDLKSIGLLNAARFAWVLKFASFWLTVALGIPALLLLPRLRGEVAS